MKIVVLDGYTLNPGDNPWDEVAKLGTFVVHDRSAEPEIVPRSLDAEIVLTY
jgi:glycerate dehydrogenase